MKVLVVQANSHLQGRGLKYAPGRIHVQHDRRLLAAYSDVPITKTLNSGTRRSLTRKLLRTHTRPLFIEQLGQVKASLRSTKRYIRGVGISAGSSDSSRTNNNSNQSSNTWDGSPGSDFPSRTSLRTPEAEEAVTADLTEFWKTRATAWSIMQAGSEIKLVSHWDTHTMVTGILSLCQRIGKLQNIMEAESRDVLEGDLHSNKANMVEREVDILQGGMTLAEILGDTYPTKPMDELLKINAVDTTALETSSGLQAPIRELGLGEDVDMDVDSNNSRVDVGSDQENGDIGSEAVCLTKEEKVQYVNDIGSCVDSESNGDADREGGGLNGGHCGDVKREGEVPIASEGKILREEEVAAWFVDMTLPTPSSPQPSPQPLDYALDGSDLSDSVADESQSPPFALSDPMELSYRIDALVSATAMSPLEALTAVGAAIDDAMYQERDDLYASSRLETLLSMTPAQLAMKVVELRACLPAHVDISRLLAQCPDLLTIPQVDIVVTGSLSELKELLPVTCVDWLVQEEPEILCGVSMVRLEALRESIVANVENLECIREGELRGVSNEDMTQEWRRWFTNVFCWA
mmetsp:Transcript_21115/g.25401  ORF Transcript_21115/g.25401 Transcript_21115/m.25401 type:complete len:577 (-) Transcript_21115:297-2027(-)